MDNPTETTTADKPLYDTDFFRWSQAQAEAIRAAASVRINTPLPIDWENVAEEIESLGISLRRELRSRMFVIVEHLLKLCASPIIDPRRGWEETISEQRAQIEQLLEQSPSLRREVPDLIEAETKRARKRLTHSAQRYQETLTRPLDELNFTPEQVLEDWFPAGP